MTVREFWDGTKKCRERQPHLAEMRRFSSMMMLTVILLLSAVACVKPSESFIAFQSVHSGMDVGELARAFPYEVEPYVDFTRLQDAHAPRFLGNAERFTGLLLFKDIEDQDGNRAELHFRNGRLTGGARIKGVDDGGLMKRLLRLSTATEVLLHTPRKVAMAAALEAEVPHRLSLIQSAGVLRAFRGKVIRVEGDPHGWSDVYEIEIDIGKVAGKNYYRNTY